MRPRSALVSTGSARCTNAPERSSAPSELSQAAVDCRRDRRRVANVRLGSGDAAAELLDLRDGLVEILGSCERIVDRVDIGADVHRDDVGALSREAHRVGATLTSSGAADNRDFAVQRSHQGFSPTARHHRG
ncbi:MAG TPA: hypothetical protein VMJ65_03985 [Solirubrobacteraceae bacterium]|nr:hypothetical protein [Solirubrobacteraceae bacterium]